MFISDFEDNSIQIAYYDTMEMPQYTYRNGEGEQVSNILAGEYLIKDSSILNICKDNYFE